LSEQVGLIVSCMFVFYINARYGPERTRCHLSGKTNVQNNPVLI
jgi:hypothetical protein